VFLQQARLKIILVIHQLEVKHQMQVQQTKIPPRKRKSKRKQIQLLQLDQLLQVMMNMILRKSKKQKSIKLKEMNMSKVSNNSYDFAQIWLEISKLQLKLNLAQ